MTTYPWKTLAFKVEQPIGTYYVAVLPAELLLDVAFSDTMSASLPEGSPVYKLEGTQRAIDERRLQAIADYINREDAAFPNSVILAANYIGETGSILTEGDVEGDVAEALDATARWDVGVAENGVAELVIPSRRKLAAIIDGQHRVFAFTKAHADRSKMQLICSIFLDLPKPYQAQLFATINSTQKQVPKSLTYELFGYNVEAEEEQYWAPDKLAVFFSRRLGVDADSPLKSRIVIAAPQKDGSLAQSLGTGEWRVSTAVIVEGIMRLYSSNPRKDTTDLLEGSKKKRSEIRTKRTDKSPLRDLYLDCQDAALYATVLNYLRACNDLFWKDASQNSFITKTVGVQALFDILRKLAKQAVFTDKNIKVDYFSQKLQPAKHIDFAGDYFRNASGSGRTQIRRAIEEALGI